MKYLGILLGFVLLTVCGCKKSTPSPTAPEPNPAAVTKPVASADSKAPATALPAIDFKSMDAEAFSRAFFAALRKGDMEAASLFAIDYDREHFAKEFPALLSLPPIPETPDLWVRVYEGKNAGRVSARDWQKDINFNLMFRDGRWWVARSN